jgi:hypothetical protein
VLPVAASAHAELRPMDNRRCGGGHGERHCGRDDGRPHLYRGGCGALGIRIQLFRLVAAHNAQQATSQHQTDGTLR